MQTHEAYLSYCIVQEESVDKPTRVVALFLKYMDGYMRSYYAAKHNNSWLLEQEGHDWLPGFKITGKSNYVTEGCHRIDTLYGRDLPNSHGLTDEELEWTRWNRLFNMFLNGNSMSLDEVNELLNLWNKEMVTSPSFEKVCEHSRYVMFHRACQMNVFDIGNRRSSRTSNQHDVARLIAFLERADIFPHNNDVKREMHKDFFWALVSRPVSGGSEKDKEREGATVRDGEEVMFSHLCKSDEERNDYREYELDVEGDDDENISIVSSTMDSIESNDGKEFEEEDWETLNETSRGAKISDALKQLGNPSKKNMNPNITKDFYGAAGDIAMKNVKRNHEKLVRKDILHVNSIFRAVRYFEGKMVVRRKMLEHNIACSENKTYVKREYWWRDEIESIMEMKRAARESIN